jgi:hypothetical protein
MAMLTKRSSSVAGKLKAIDHDYAEYMNTVPQKPIATKLLAHSLPVLFLIGWAAVLIVLLFKS